MREMALSTYSDRSEPQDFDADPSVIRVGLAEGLERLAAPLVEALGPGFNVRVGSVPDRGVAVITAQGQAAMAFLRAQHPRTLFLVDRLGSSRHTDDAAAYLNAGADGYIETSVPGEIAAHVAALGRRCAESGHEPSDR